MVFPIYLEALYDGIQILIRFIEIESFSVLVARQWLAANLYLGAA